MRTSASFQRSAIMAPASAWVTDSAAAMTAIVTVPTFDDRWRICDTVSVSVPSISLSSTAATVNEADSDPCGITTDVTLPL